MGSTSRKGLRPFGGTPGESRSSLHAAGSVPHQTPETDAELRGPSLPPPRAVTLCIGLETPPFGRDANYSSLCALCHLLKIGCLVFSSPQVQLSLGK